MEFLEPLYPQLYRQRYRACPHCAARMLLKSIEPDRPGYDKRAFACVDCRHEEFVVVKFRDSFLGKCPTNAIL